MIKKHRYILSILIFSSIIRFYKLGIVPLGVSLEEAKYGVGLNATVIRLPFVLMGIGSIFLFYLIIKKIIDYKTALIGSALLGIIPWHVQDSRVYSPGIILLTAFLFVFLLLSGKIQSNKKLFFKITSFVCGTIFLISVLFILPQTPQTVNSVRTSISLKSPKIISYIFVNKFVENYRQREKLLFENIDFGNYFFSGHPLERWGIAEEQKLLLFTLPFIFWGLTKIGRENGVILAGYFILCLGFLTLFSFRQSESLILIVPFAILFAIGVREFPNKNILITILLFGLFELTSFYKSYILGFSESQFSPRRPIYIELSSELARLKTPGEKVLVNDRLGDPKIFLRYYLNGNISDYEFRNFRYSDEKNKDRIFVDVLPDDPSPSEPLYMKDGSLPTDLNVKWQSYDQLRKQKIIIYQTK